MSVIIQPRPFNPRKTITVLSVLLVALYFYYQRPPAWQLWRLTGSTMGTTYSVKVLENHLGQPGVELLKKEIDERLVEVNREMSTYLPDSEISLFNGHESIEPFPVSPGFAEVAGRAIDLCSSTGRAFDPTLDRLINLWGFGPQGPRETPGADDIARALELTGCHQVRIHEAGQQHHLVKAHAGVTLNLNAIAKGWGVDEVARLIESKGITNYFVEIGGEVYAKGMSEKMRPWRVGIDRPVEGSHPGEAFDLIVELNGAGLATSGNYRNMLDTPQGKIAHILDPRMGQPATTSLASVSVIALDCATADALATGLFVMGAEAGLAWLTNHPAYEAIFIEHGTDGTLVTRSTPGMSRYLVAKE